MTATEFKARVLAVLDDVDQGDEVEITKHGRTVARLIPARGAHGLVGKHEGMGRQLVGDEAMFSTGETWDAG